MYPRRMNIQQNNLYINVYLNKEKKVMFEVSVNLSFRRQWCDDEWSREITARGETLEEATVKLKVAVEKAAIEEQDALKTKTIWIEGSPEEEIEYE